MLKNVVEVLVEEKLDSMWKHSDCCKCDICREDILAITLTKLPPHYISTTVGELYAKAKLMSTAYDFQIMRELAFAMKIVAENPRHKK